MEGKTNVLFVCLGNICRSPLAEGIFKQKVLEKGLSDQFTADSCGTSSYHIGDQPDSRTRQNASEHGIKLFHQARQISLDDLKNFDFLLVMDKKNLEDVLFLDPEGKYSDKIRLVRSFEKGADDLNVPDPYFGGEEGFENVFHILDRSLEGLLDYLVESGKLKER